MNKSGKILVLIGAIVLIIAAVSVFAYNGGVFAGDPEITEEEAKTIAEEYTNGQAISVELEREGSSLVYEVIIVNATGRYDVEIDAKDGSILEIEENDYEDDDHEEDDDDHEEDDDEEEHEDEHEDNDEEEDDH